jgi:putative polyhydroxyalkanoate system protein
MATISVAKTHGLGQDEALRRAQELCRTLADRLKAEITWTSRGATFKGSGFTGTALVSGDKVTVDVDLGLMLRPLKNKITSRIEQQLDEKFV